MFPADRLATGGGADGVANAGRRVCIASSGPVEVDMHPLEENLTFMDFLAKFAIALGVVGGGALLLAVLVMAIV